MELIERLRDQDRALQFYQNNADRAEAAARIEALEGAFLDLGERDLIRPGQLLALGHEVAAEIVRAARATLKGTP